MYYDVFVISSAAEPKIGGVLIPGLGK